MFALERCGLRRGNSKRRVARALLALLLAGPILPALAAEPDAPSALINRAHSIRIIIQNDLSGKLAGETEAEKNARGALVEYYSDPDARLLWVDESGITERGRAVMEEIAKADDFGLRSADYELPKPAVFNANDRATTDWLADAEIKISFAVLRYARDARGGRLEPQRLSPNLDPNLALPDPFELISSIAFRSDPAAYLRSFQPDQPQFEALRQKLIELRGGMFGDEKPLVNIPDGPPLKLGVEHEQVMLLRKRLDLPPGESETMFDEAVLKAVTQFQMAHNTAADGIVGPGTRRLLNAPQRRYARIHSQIRTILVNMERWRWLPHVFGPFYVIVNVPEFMLRVVKDGEVIHSGRVVVGKIDKQTPVFSQDMQEIVFNPYWNVPDSIKTEEISPYIASGGAWFFGWNTSVFKRHNLRINYGGREVDPDSLDWSRVDIRNLKIYQPPGPGNVLGNVKFVFPNKHAVYMHDTPQKFLFAKPVRAESHGCMRVQNPDQLALALLEHDQGWSEGRIASAIQNGYDQHVALQRKIPVHVTYFTLRVNEDSSISTFGDLYAHDARMSVALYGERWLAPVTSNYEAAPSREKPRGRDMRRSGTSGNPLTEALSGFLVN